MANNDQAIKKAPGSSGDWIEDRIPKGVRRATKAETKQAIIALFKCDCNCDWIGCYPCDPAIADCVTCEICDCECGS